MATAPQPLPPFAAARRGRASAVRRFPPGCGRQHSNAAAPPRRPVPAPDSANGDPPPNPYPRAAAKTSSTSTPAAARFPGHDRGGMCGPMAGNEAPAVAEVVVRRLSAVRRYPPGCGRGVCVPKPEPSAVAREEEGGGCAIQLLAAVCDVEAQAIAGDRELVPSAGTLYTGDADSDGAGRSGGDGGGALEGSGSPGPPCAVTAIALAPLVPWAHHGQRSRQLRKTF